MEDDVETPSEKPAESGASASDQALKAAIEVRDNVGTFINMIDAWLEKILGAIGNRPWDKWLSQANAFIGKYIPFAIVLSGVLAFATGLVVTIKEDMPVSFVFANFGTLVVTLFAMVLAPKALALSRSFIEKGEPDMLRPEFLFILKVLLGLGGMLLGIFGVLKFDADLIGPSIGVLAGAALLVIVFTNPGLVGYKAGYPKNGVEEAISILLLPVRIVLCLLTLAVGVASLGGIVWGVVKMFESGVEAQTILSGATTAPFLLPLAVYFAYLVIMFSLDFYRAMVSIPRKLDDVRDAVEKK